MSFYNRYVPSKASEAADSQVEEPLQRPAKKRRIDVKDEKSQVNGELGRADVSSGRKSSAKQDVVFRTRIDEDTSAVPGWAGVDRKPASKKKAKTGKHQAVADSSKQTTQSRKNDPTDRSRSMNNSDASKIVCINGDHETIADAQASSQNEGVKTRKSKKSKKKQSEHSQSDHDQNVTQTPSDSDQVTHKSIFSKFAQATGGRAAAGKTDTNGSSSDEDATEVHGLEPLPQPAQAPDAPRVSITAALPSWIREPIVVSEREKQSFVHLGIDDDLLRRLSELKIASPLPIQYGVIPLLSRKSGHRGDLCISAATGSGKTLAYAIPMVQALKGKFGHKLRGVVVVPTRELVVQAKDTLELLIKGTDLRVATAVGSQPLKVESEALVCREQRFDPEARKREKERIVNIEEELMDWDFDAMMNPDDLDDRLPHYVLEYALKVDILICTPGRLVEHINSTKGFSLQDVQWLVIDEADRLLNDSFQEWVDTVIPQLEYVPPVDPLQRKMILCAGLPEIREVQKVILSATMTRDVSKLGALKLRKPKMVILEGTEMAEDDNLDALELPSTLDEYAVMIEDPEIKPLALLKILESRPPEPKMMRINHDSTTTDANSHTDEDTQSSLASDSDTAPSTSVSASQPDSDSDPSSDSDSSSLSSSSSGSNSGSDQPLPCRRRVAASEECQDTVRWATGETDPPSAATSVVLDSYHQQSR